MKSGEENSEAGAFQGSFFKNLLRIFVVAITILFVCVGLYYIFTFVVGAPSSLVESGNLTHYIMRGDPESEYVRFDMALRYVSPNATISPYPKYESAGNYTSEDAKLISSTDTIRVVEASNTLGPSGRPVKIAIIKVPRDVSPEKTIGNLFVSLHTSGTVAPPVDCVLVPSIPKEMVSADNDKQVIEPMVYQSVLSARTFLSGNLTMVLMPEGKSETKAAVKAIGNAVNVINKHMEKLQPGSEKLVVKYNETF